MKYSRREMLRWAGGAALTLPWIESGCLRGRPLAQIFRSRAPLPKPFEASLPILPVLKPSGSDAVSDCYEMAVRPASGSILPGLTTEIWGYNGTFPGPVIEARRGRKTSLRLRNELPVPIVNHLHGGRTAPESDGYPTDLVMPKGEFPAPHMHDPRARVAHEEREYVYDNEQRGATLWYHDHRMDFTAPQVWRGLAGFYILRDEEEARLPLPRGDKEIALLLCDRSFGEDGSLIYPSIDPTLKGEMGVPVEYMGGVLGDVILVNGVPWPRLEVANTRYRFRILNASNARRYDLALDPVGGASPFVQIGSDGGLLAAPVAHRSIQIAPAERFDVVIDFSHYRVGSQMTLLNRAADGPQGRVMRFDVVREEHDESSIPAHLSKIEFPDPARVDATRVFNFSYRGQDGWTINRKPFDPDRMDARPKLGSTEIWRLETDFSHPLHLHLVHFQVLSHSGRPGPYDSGWKDTIDLGAGQVANILVPFDGYRGRYVFHCHNLEHEDMAMMGNFEVV
jgi:spore coat protein A, manganese oxidase